MATLIKIGQNESPNRNLTLKGIQVTQSLDTIQDSYLVD